MSLYNDDNDWIGQSIGDRQRYRLEAHLGRGGMGDVFLAMDVVLGKKVAIKLLKGALTTTEEFKKRFDREVAICAALSSDNIVQVSDYGITDEDQPFYVMEYLQGETLRQRLMRQIRLPIAESLSIMIQVCLGLQIPHEGVPLWLGGATHSELVRVVHRDLKPDNIFLITRESGEVIKLLDFGIAKIFYEEPDNKTSLTRTNEFMGTPRYASPEQLSGLQDLDARADIYSLGVILYEMICGQSPFHEEGKALTSMVAWAIAHTSQSPRPLRTQAACLNISPSLEATILKCLHKEPSDRFATVKELRESLEAELQKLQQEPDVTISVENINPIILSETLPSKHSFLQEGALNSGALNNRALKDIVTNDSENEISANELDLEFIVQDRLNPGRQNIPQATAAPPELQPSTGLNPLDANLRSQPSPSPSSPSSTFVMPGSEVPPPVAPKPTNPPLAMILGILSVAIAAMAGVYFFLINKASPPIPVDVSPTSLPTNQTAPLPTGASSLDPSPQPSTASTSQPSVVDICKTALSSENCK